MRLKQPPKRPNPSDKVVRKWLVKPAVRLRPMCLVLRSATLGIQQRRSSTVVILDGEPTERINESGEQITEYVDVSGFVPRFGRKGLPLIDSGNDASVRNVFGSIRHMRVDQGRLMGEISWSSDVGAEKARVLYEEGHISDFRARYIPLEVVKIPFGKQYRGIFGPAELVTRYTPIHVSVYAG